MRSLTLAFRQLWRAYPFALTVMFTLGTAIATNLIVYGVASSLMLHPLPVADPSRLVQIEGSDASGLSISYPNYLDLREASKTITGLAIARLGRMAIGADGVTQPAWGYFVSGNYFSTLGVSPQSGRLFGPNDDVAKNSSFVAVMSDLCWKSRFHSDPSIVGRVIQVNKHPYTVIGVTQPGFGGTERLLWPEIWIPFHDGPQIDGYSHFEERGANDSWVFGRLQAGISKQQADAELRVLSSTLSSHYTEDDGVIFHTSRPGLLGDRLSGPIHMFVAGLMVLALLVLATACANLALLFLTRAASRATEVGIRIALGSTRFAILRQLMVETIVLTLCSGIIAVVITNVALRRLASVHLPTDAPIQLAVHPDWTVYAIALTLSCVAAFFFGTLPAWQLWRTDLGGVIRTKGAANAKERSVGRSALLVLQVSLCCFLVATSFVAARGLERARLLPIGIEPRGVTIATVDVTSAGYEGTALGRVQQRMLQAVLNIPQVSGAAYSDSVPLSAANQSSQTIYSPDVALFDNSHITATASVYSVSPTYFDVTGTRIVAGRAFTDQDGPTSPYVAVVNQTFARQVFGSDDVVGRRFPLSKEFTIEVVGVAEDGKYQSLSEAPTPAFYEPIQQRPAGTTYILVRSNSDQDSIISAVRRSIGGVDANVPVYSVVPWTDALGTVLFPARASTIVSGILGVLASGLAVTGVFGVASYTVSRRMRALSIRVALGAKRKDVVQAALGQTFLLLLAGSVLGLAMSFVASRALGAVVYHASIADPVVLLTVFGTLSALGFLAVISPVRRALATDPASLLKDE